MISEELAEVLQKKCNSLKNGSPGSILNVPVTVEFTKEQLIGVIVIMNEQIETQSKSYDDYIQMTDFFDNQRIN